MKIKLQSFTGSAKGEVELNPAVFGLPVRPDLLLRAVEYQRAKARAGTHKTKGISEISGTTKRPYKQKGTGRARHGSTRSPQFRGGATIFGPVVRSHAIDLPKKVRKLALKIALSMKAAEGSLLIVDNLELAEAKTKALKAQLTKMNLRSVLVVDGAAVNDAFKRASANIPHVDVLPQIGANVLDIMRHDTLVLTKEAVAQLEARLQ